MWHPRDSEVAGVCRIVTQTYTFARHYDLGPRDRILEEGCVVQSKATTGDLPLGAINRSYFTALTLARYAGQSVLLVRYDP